MRFDRGGVDYEVSSPHRITNVDFRVYDGVFGRGIARQEGQIHVRDVFLECVRTHLPFRRGRRDGERLRRARLVETRVAVESDREKHVELRGGRRTLLGIFKRNIASGIVVTSG